MINVNDNTIKAYTEYSCDKKITISFPGTNIPTITNKNLQEESMNITETLCEESSLQTGGCNATIFEITTLDISTDLTGKNIVVTQSLRDEHYKGDWNYESEYSQGDIVKFNECYYKYFTTPPSDASEWIKRVAVPHSDWNSRNISGAPVYVIQTPTVALENLAGFRFESSEPPAGTYITLIVIFDDSPTPVTKALDTTYFDRNIDFLDLFSEKEGHSVVSWSLSISGPKTASDLLDEWAELSEAYSLRYIPTNKLYPIFLSDYCSQIYGYLDTSEIPDSVIYRGRIDAFEKQADPRYRKITAFDKMYDLSKVSIKNWINTVNEYGRGYIEKYNYRGMWEAGTTDYKANDVVYAIEGDGINVTVVYYHYKKDMDIEAWLNHPLSILANQSVGVTKGKQYIEKLSNYYPNRPTVKTLRNALCSYLGITQEDVILPLDDMELTIGEFVEETSARQLLRWICNLNMVYGYIVPATGKLRYVFINKEKKALSADSNYKGEFDIEKSYGVNDVVSVVKDTGVTYYKNILSLSGKVPSSYISLDVTDKFITPETGKKFLAPISRLNKWYIEFDFDEELAQELNISIELRHYTGPNNEGTNKKMVLKAPGKVFLTQFIGDGYVSITIQNVTDEFWDSFQAILYAANGDEASEYFPYEEIVSEFWEECNPFYHPSGRINLSSLYECDSVMIKDGKFKNLGYKVVDTSNNVVFGSTEDVSSEYINIVYSPLYSTWKEAYQIYIDVQEYVGYAQKYFTIEYTPFSLSSLGVPFLEVGDYICFDVIEWSSDKDENPVITTKTIDSIIIHKELSGINALTNKLEARYD